MDPRYVVEHRRTIHFDRAREQVWDQVMDLPAVAAEWSWVRDLEVTPGPLREGSRITFVAVAPVPYRLHLALDVESIDPGRRLAVRVDRDLEGVGSIELTDAKEGTSLTLAWRAEMKQATLRVAARVARPMLSWGHDWAVRSAIEAFRRRLEGDIHDT